MTARTRRTALLALILALAGAAGGASPAAAQDRDSTRIRDRVDTRRADRSLVTQSGDVALLLMGDTLLVQLTDRGMEEVAAPDDEDTGLAGAILGAMLRAGVRELLDHAIAYPVSEIGRAEYLDGRLILEDLEGDELFDITTNDRNIMTDFHDRQARAFAREVRERMQH